MSTLARQPGVAEIEPLVDDASSIGIANRAVSRSWKPITLWEN
jgi:hypothetical protein